MTQTSSSLKKEVGVAGDVEDGAFVVAAAVDGAFVVAVGTVVEDAVATIPIIRRRGKLFHTLSLESHQTEFSKLI
jgi:hypothetical protein